MCRIGHFYFVMNLYAKDFLPLVIIDGVHRLAYQTLQTFPIGDNSISLVQHLQQIGGVYTSLGKRLDPVDDHAMNDAVRVCL